MSRGARAASAATTDEVRRAECAPGVGRRRREERARRSQPPDRSPQPPWLLRQHPRGREADEGDPLEHREEQQRSEHPGGGDRSLQEGVGDDDDRRQQRRPEHRGQRERHRTAGLEALDQAGDEGADVEQHAVRHQKVDGVQQRQEEGGVRHRDDERAGQGDEGEVDEPPQDRPAPGEAAALGVGERELERRGRDGAQTQVEHGREPVRPVRVRPGDEDEPDRQADGEEGARLRRAGPQRHHRGAHQDHEEPDAEHRDERQRHPPRARGPIVDAIARCWRLACAALAGGLTLLALSPHRLGWVAWVALVPFFVALGGATWRATIAVAVVYTLTFSLGGLEPWFARSTSAYFRIPLARMLELTAPPLALLAVAHGTLLGALLLARPRRAGPRQVLWCAALWAGWEYVRTLVFPYYPAAVLGLSQHATVAVLQLASLTGVAGVSFVLLACNVGLASLIAPSGAHGRARAAAAATGIAAAAAAIVWGTMRIAGGMETSSGPRVAAVDVKARGPS